jgi:hypothetical protein
MTARHAAWCLAVAASCCCAFPALGGPWLPPPGDYRSEFQGGYYSADDFYGEGGGRLPLAFGGVEERRSLLNYNEFGWKKSASLILGIPIESVTRRSAGGEVNRTDTGIGDLELGMRIKMAGGPSAAALQITWYPPAGYNRKYLLTSSQIASADAGECAGLTGADSINCVRQMAPSRLGPGEQEVSAAIHWGTAIRKFNGFLQASQGYRYRGQLAGQALFTADLGFWVGHSVLVAGRYRGAIDVGRGTTRADDVEEHLAGPLLLYRLDDGMDVFYSSLHTAVARNALHADRFYVGVAFYKTELDRLQGYLGGTKQPK